MLGIRNFYVVKQTDGTLWNFTYKDNFGIIYRVFKKNSWSSYNILVKNSSKAFSALILPDNRICVIYQSSSGNLLLKVYSGEEWEEHSILHKKNNAVSDLQFKTIYALGKIQIFYSILQPHDNIRTLFHQTLTLESTLNVSPPVLIDTTNVNHINQFAVHSLEDNSICIMYQKLINKYELGYKVLEDNSAAWSKFYSVDKNISPYIDYSLGSVKQKLNILYIKNDGEASTLYDAAGYIPNLEHTKIAEGSNLISCAVYRKNDISYGFWISNDYLYSCYINGTADNINPVKSEGLKSMNVFKSVYIEIASNNRYVSNEMYVHDGTSLYILPNNFFTNKEELKVRKNNEISIHSSNMNHAQQNITNNTEEKAANIEIRLAKKDQLINQLNYIIKEERNKALLLNNKISILEKDNLELEKQKSQFYKDINLLQEALIKKENQINELEKTMIEKETKSLELTRQNNNSEQYNKKIAEMSNQAENYKASILNLNKIMEDLKSKNHVLEIENQRNQELKNNIEEYKNLIENLSKVNESLNSEVITLQPYRNKAELMEKETDEYKKIVENLKENNEKLNSKISSLEEEKAMLINDKNNSSLLKKLFGSQ